jgi:hypothetical protein
MPFETRVNYPRRVTGVSLSRRTGEGQGEGVFGAVEPVSEQNAFTLTPALSHPMGEGDALTLTSKRTRAPGMGSGCSLTVPPKTVRR